MSDRLAQTLAVLKLAAYGGPVAVAFSAGGSALLAVALFDRAGSHFDVAVVLGATGMVLGLVEWSLSRRFRLHEEVERQNYATLAMTAESAAAAAIGVTQRMSQVRYDFDASRADLLALQVDVKMHDRRLGAVEERLMRAALMVPSPRKPGGND